MRYRDPKKESDLFSMIEHQQSVPKAVKGINKLNAVIDWELFREDLESILGYDHRDPKRGGRPPFDAVLMLKVLILQKYYGLSDEAVFADSAYQSEASEAYLLSKDCQNFVLFKGRRGHPLSEEEQATNKQRSRLRRSKAVFQKSPLEFKSNRKQLNALSKDIASGGVDPGDPPRHSLGGSGGPGQTRHPPKTL